MSIETGKYNKMNDKTKQTLLNKYGKYLILALILVLILFSGSKAYNYHKDQLKPLDSLKTVLEDRDKQEAIKIEKAVDSVLSLDKEFNRFEGMYIQEYNHRRRLEKQIKDIINMKFNKKYLDSLADFYLYE